MARSRLYSIRWLKEAWFADLSNDARWLYLGLLALAADDAVFKWEPSTMRRAVFPDRPGVNVYALLDEMRARDLVRLFRAGGRNYGVIANFGKSQTVRRAFVSGILPGDLYGYAAVVHLRETAVQIDFQFPAAPLEIVDAQPQQKRRKQRRK
jgi:hypothetical protein